MKKRKYINFILGALIIFGASNSWALSQELTLDFGRLGTPKIQVVIPDGALSSGQSLPVILLVSGFQTSRQLANVMSESLGNNILVAYEYPLDDKINWLDWSNPSDARMASVIPSIPLQIAGVLSWLRGPQLINQFGVKADPDRINTVTVSLGIFFVPAALKLAQVQGFYENSVVLAYAGAKLSTVVEGQMRQSQAPLVAQFLGPVIQAITSPFEPTNYISDVHAKHFLIVNASDDQIFTRESQQALIDATPQPKDIVSVPGVHIGLDQSDRVASSIKLLRDWMLSNGAINK